MAVLRAEAVAQEVALQSEAFLQCFHAVQRIFHSVLPIACYCLPKRAPRKRAAPRRASRDPLPLRTWPSYAVSGFIGHRFGVHTINHACAYTWPACAKRIVPE